MMAKWSKWQDIKEFKSLGNNFGVYKVRLVDSSGFPVAIGRLVGKDDKGLLAIGSTKHLAGRVGKFCNALDKGADSHSVGERLFLIRVACRRIPRKYKDTKFQVAVMKLASDPAEEEGILLTKYFLKYGELPPLNNSSSLIETLVSGCVKPMSRHTRVIGAK